MCSLIISVFQYQAWRQEFQVLQEHGYYGTQASHYCRLCQALPTPLMWRHKIVWLCILYRWDT